MGCVRSEFGQWRDKGRIGKAMRIMAGGPFPEKVKTLVVLPAVGTGGHMATRAFGIVEHGNQGDRKKLARPGIDRAAAFPFELVVMKVGAF